MVTPNNSCLTWTTLPQDNQYKREINLTVTRNFETNKEFFESVIKLGKLLEKKGWDIKDLDASIDKN